MSTRRGFSLPLPLLVPRILAADHPHHALALDDLAVAADAFHRCEHFHVCSFFRLFCAEHDTAARQIVRRQFHGHLVAGQDADVVHAHLPGDVPEHDMAVLELHSECCVRQGLHDLALHLDGFFFRHYRVGNTPPLKFDFFSRLSYWCDITYACTCAMKSMVTTTMMS